MKRILAALLLFLTFLPQTHPASLSTALKHFRVLVHKKQSEHRLALLPKFDGHALRLWCKSVLLPKLSVKYLAKSVASMDRYTLGAWGIMLGHPTLGFGIVYVAGELEELVNVPQEFPYS